MGTFGIDGNQAAMMASQAIDNVTGMALQSRNIKKQIKGQKELMNEQARHARELSDFQQQQQLKMWEATGYGAQVKQMKEAGINPALMYGISGGGGQTIGGATSTSVNPASIDASSGIQQGIALSQMAMQKANMMAQNELLKAQAEKTKAETARLGGPETEEIKARTKGIEIQNGINQIKLSFEQPTQEAQLKGLEEGIEKIKAENKILTTQGDINKASKEAKIFQNNMEAIGAYIENIAREAGIKLTQQQAWGIAQNVAQGWKGLQYKNQELGIQKGKQEIEKGLAEFQKSHPNAGQVIGGKVEGGLNKLWQLFDELRHPYYYE